MMSAARMPPESFQTASLLVPVRKAGPGAPTALELSSDRHAALRLAVENGMAAAGVPELSAQAMASILAVNTEDDVWYSQLADGTMVILVKDDILSTLSERDVVERVHRSIVEDASESGYPVPADVLNYYRNRPRPELPAHMP